MVHSICPRIVVADRYLPVPGSLPYRSLRNFQYVDRIPVGSPLGYIIAPAGEKHPEEVDDVFEFCLPGPAVQNASFVFRLDIRLARQPIIGNHSFSLLF
jgi:hypothetical protein